MTIPAWVRVTVLCCLAAAAPSAAAPAPPKAKSPAADARTVISFPTFGVAVAPPPAGWVRTPEPGPNHIARWGLPVPGTNRLRALLTVEVVPLQSDTLAQYADSLARAMGATVSTDAAQLGGGEAIYLRAVAASYVGGEEKIQPVGAYVAQHGKYAYVVGALALPSQAAPAAEALEAMRQGFRWIEIERAANHLESRPEWLTVFNNRMIMSVPATARPYKVDLPGAEMNLGIYDYLYGDGEFFVHTQIVPAGGTDLPEARDLLGREFAKRFGVDKPFAWHAVPGRPRWWVSSHVEVRLGEPRPDSRPQTLRFVLIPLGERSTGLMTFSYWPADAEGRKAYDAAVKAIVTSIEPAPARKRADAVARVETK